MNYLMILRGQATATPDAEVVAYLNAVGSELLRTGVLLDGGQTSESGPAFTAGRDGGSGLRINASRLHTSDAEILAYWAVRASTSEEMEYWAVKFPPPPGTRLEVRALL
jgi:hypothetical protein